MGKKKGKKKGELCVAEAAAAAEAGPPPKAGRARGHVSSWPMTTMHNALGLSTPLTSNTTLAAAQPAVNVDYVAKYLAKPALQLDFDFDDMLDLESASSSDFDPDNILELVGDSSSKFGFGDMPELESNSGSDIDDMPDLGALALPSAGTYKRSDSNWDT